MSGRSSARALAATAVATVLATRWPAQSLATSVSGVSSASMRPPLAAGCCGDTNGDRADRWTMAHMHVETCPTTPTMVTMPQFIITDSVCVLPSARASTGDGRLHS